MQHIINSQNPACYSQMAKMKPTHTVRLYTAPVSSAFKKSLKLRRPGLGNGELVMRLVCTHAHITYPFGKKRNSKQPERCTCSTSGSLYFGVGIIHCHREDGQNLNILSQVCPPPSPAILSPPPWKNQPRSLRRFCIQGPPL